MKLTDMAIKKAKPREKVYSLGDGNGLSLIVEPNGSKGWRFRYQFNGKSKMISLGIYPVVTLNEAREKRDNARKLVANGVDPSEARKEERNKVSGQSENTFKKITLEWFNGRKDRWSEGYRDDMMEAFENDVFPYIGDRPIAEIKPLELLEVLSIMEKRGVTEKLKKVRQRCGEVWKYAIITGRAEYNPAPDLASAFIPHQRENYPYLLADELPEFLSSVDKYQGSQIVRTALNILMLTGLRPGELRKSEWSFIDFESRTWKLPEKIMKMGRVHVVPMSDQVISLLRQIQPISGDYQYIFPSRTNHKKHLSEMAINTMIGRMGYRGRATGHGFRHTMSTILHEKGFNTAWIELQLAHVDKNSIRGTYNHALYLEGRREMMQWYADYIDELRSKKK
ncbi:TPA: tyrosine-type recombinase/integrase [Proteus mirabilis]|uniref:tyrosine-type recombinase/integrase n=1 Tax=Proteus mirabilis TaxID=584 RepID=UPI0013D7AA43|nr:integrase arm-type DNA-binding domain-containing protein [Proteus mirabilis]MBI6331722.1 tyrosine-type recombinase/integrase [Proteus mirabilis]HEJ9402985.1 tyrosine-type recombinase/integrase [Proteus mirabilis]HEJ9406843.1 tyrosine-type recombinase/integrase [Proteus mirabilis]HEK0400223.1 tyrosine-type recombinase/integrase [Proteus mirabilis]HEK1917309.1 tyrosine-type recombinase/integrase [Proteus mirabilis]